MLASNRVYDVASRYAMQYSKTGYIHDLAQKRLVLLAMEQLVAIAKGWSQMIWVTRKTMSSILCMFLVTQRPGKYFHNTKM